MEPAIERCGYRIVAFAGQGYGQNPAFPGFAAFAGSGFTKNYAPAWFDRTGSIPCEIINKQSLSR